MPMLRRAHGTDDTKSAYLGEIRKTIDAPTQEMGTMKGRREDATIRGPTDYSYSVC
jgi:hypothetical protein